MDDFILHKKSVIPSEDCIKTIGIFEYHKEDHERWEQFDHTLSEVFVRREDLPLCIGKPLHDMVEDYRKKYSVLDVLSQSWSLYRRRVVAIAWRIILFVNSSWFFLNLCLGYLQSNKSDFLVS